MMTPDSEAGKSGPQPGPSTPAASPPPAAPAPAAVPAQISIEEFQKLALRIGKIVGAAEHPKADRLLVLSVEIGEPSPRQVVAGIKPAYQPSELVGKTVVVVTNLKPAMLRGVESQGMVLAAQDTSGLTLVAPERPLAPGSVVK